MLISLHLGGEDHALVAEVDVDGPQVGPAEGGALTETEYQQTQRCLSSITHVKYGDLREIL